MAGITLTGSERRMHCFASESHNEQYYIRFHICGLLQAKLVRHVQAGVHETLQKDAGVHGNMRGGSSMCQ